MHIRLYAEGRPQAVTWGGPGALVQMEGPNNSVRHRLVVDAGVVEIGWFLLGTMRQERDFQYMGPASKAVW